MPNTTKNQCGTAHNNLSADTWPIAHFTSNGQAANYASKAGMVPTIRWVWKWISISFNWISKSRPAVWWLHSWMSSTFREHKDQWVVLHPNHDQGIPMTDRCMTISPPSSNKPIGLTLNWNPSLNQTIQRHHYWYSDGHNHTPIARASVVGRQAHCQRSFGPLIKRHHSGRYFTVWQWRHQWQLWGCVIGDSIASDTHLFWRGTWWCQDQLSHQHQHSFATSHPRWCKGWCTIWNCHSISTTIILWRPVCRQMRHWDGQCWSHSDREGGDGWFSDYLPQRWQIQVARMGQEDREEGCLSATHTMAVFQPQCGYVTAEVFSFI